jgi:hypothetical protein
VKDWPPKEDSHLSDADNVLLLITFLGILYCVSKIFSLGLSGVEVP